MKKLLSILILTFSFAGIYANHLSGGEITYSCLGDNGDGTSTYEITFKVYRDCDGQDYQPLYYLKYNSGCDVTENSLTVNMVGNPVQLTGYLCPNDITTCMTTGVPNVQGIEVATYQGQVTLDHCTLGNYRFWFENPPGWNDWFLTNVVSGGVLGQNLFVDAEFEVDQAPACIDGPIFGENLMNVTICAGEYFRFNFDSAMVAGGYDSVSFHLHTPEKNKFGDPIQYNTGFNGLNPIQATGFNLDPVTGVLDFTAGPAQSSILAIKIIMYDAAGNEIGYVIREMNIVVRNCNNTAPELTGVDGTQEDTVYLCGGQTTCFYIYASDAEGDNLTATTSSVVPTKPNTMGVVPLASGGWRVCWMPDTTGVWTIEVGTRDDHCPGSLESFKTITVIVPDDSLFQCECSLIDFTFDNICAGSTTTFTGFGDAAGETITDWLWDFGDGTTSNLQSPTHTYANPGDYDVTLSFTAAGINCTKSVTSSLTICGPPNMGFVQLDSCQVAYFTPNQVPFVDTSTSECTIFRRAWDFGDGNGLPLDNGQVNVQNPYIDSGSYTVQLILEYGDQNATTRCYDTLNQDIYIHPKPQFIIEPDNFYQSCDPTYDTLYYVNLNDTSHIIQWYVNGAAVPVSDGGDEDTLFINTYTMTLDSFRFDNINVSVRIEDSLGCYEDSMRQILDPVHPRFINSPYCESGDTIKFWDITDTALLHYDLVSRLWDFGDPTTTADNDTAAITQWLFPSEGIYYTDMYYLDSDSCYDWAARPTIKVLLPDDEFHVYASGDPNRDNDTICFNTQSITFEGPGGDAEINRYVWIVDTTNFDSLVIVNRYNGSWFHNTYNNGTITSSITKNTADFTYLYDSTNYGVKIIEMYMVYNTIRDDGNSFVEYHDGEPLFCVRNYRDTIDIRPPQNIEWFSQNVCSYDTFQLSATQMPGGDSIVSWFVDFGDECIDCDSVYSEADTFMFGNGDTIYGDSIYVEYQYSEFPSDIFPNGRVDIKGERVKTITIVDEFGCVNTFTKMDQVIRIDSQEIVPFNFCDNEAIFFPPNQEIVNAGGDTVRMWRNGFENIVHLHWDFGVDSITNDTLLLNIQTNATDSVLFTYPSDDVYNITLTAYNSGRQCYSSVTTEFAVQPAPRAQLSIPGVQCVGSPVEFFDLSVADSIWKLNDNGNYVRIPDTLTKWVMHIDGDTIFMNDEITTVNGDTVDLDNFSTGGFEYTYSTSYHDTVTLFAITDTGCISSYSIPTYTAPYPVANFGCLPNLPGPRSELVFIDSTDWVEGDDIQHADSAYRWTLTDEAGNVEYFEMGYDIDEVTYTIDHEDIFYMELIAMNMYRCSDTIRKEIDSYSYLDFPTAFSPTRDGDPENDVFRLHWKGFDELVEYRVFNRYGEVVFQGETLDDVWDGRYKGRLQETGMYVVIVRAIDVLGREKQLRKNVLLVR